MSFSTRIMFIRIWLANDNCLPGGTTQPIVPCPLLLYHSKKMLRSLKHIDYAHLFSLGLGKLFSGVTKVSKEEMPGIAWATYKDKRRKLASTRVEGFYGQRQLRQLFTSWSFSGLLHCEQRREKHSLVFWLEGWAICHCDCHWRKRTPCLHTKQHERGKVKFCPYPYQSGARRTQRKEYGTKL